MHPPHAACKAASPLWNMRPHLNHSGKVARRPGAAPGKVGFGDPPALLARGVSFPKRERSGKLPVSTAVVPSQNSDGPADPGPSLGHRGLGLF